MATSIPTHSHNTILRTYICSIYTISKYFLTNILNYITCTMSGEILLCSNVLRTCTWKIVFKIENNGSLGSTRRNCTSQTIFFKSFSKLFHKNGSLGSTACFENKTGAWAQPFTLKSHGSLAQPIVLKSKREPGFNHLL